MRYNNRMIHIPMEIWTEILIKVEGPVKSVVNMLGVDMKFVAIRKIQNRWRKHRAPRLVILSFRTDSSHSSIPGQIVERGMLYYKVLVLSSVFRHYIYVKRRNDACYVLTFGA